MNAKLTNLGTPDSTTSKTTTFTLNSITLTIRLRCTLWKKLY